MNQPSSPNKLFRAAQAFFALTSAAALSVYALSIPFESLNHLVLRSYYALHVTALPAVMSVINGGLGSAVAETLGERCPTPIERIGLKDTFGESGTPRLLFDKYGMSPKHIAEAARRVIRRKGREAVRPRSPLT